MSNSTNNGSVNEEVELRLDRKKSAYVLQRAAEYKVSIVKTETIKFLGITLGSYITLKGESKKINALVLNAHYA